MSKQVCLVFSYRLEWLLILFTVLLVQPAKAQEIPKSDHRLSDRLAKTLPQAKPSEATNNNLRNGFAVQDNYINPIAVDRIEVLKGPASVLYDQFEPGGVVNYVTKQPLSTPSYAGELTVVNYDFYRPSLDISRPLTPDKNALYRLNAAYEHSDSFVDIVRSEDFSIAPVLSLKLSDATTLTLEYEHNTVNRTLIALACGQAMNFKVVP